MKRWQAKKPRLATNKTVSRKFNFMTEKKIDELKQIKLKKSQSQRLTELFQLMLNGGMKDCINITMM